MAGIEPILITPVQAVRLRHAHTTEELKWAQEMMDIYGCFPIDEANAGNMRSFVMDVFAAGRISGIREAHKQKKDESGYIWKEAARCPIRRKTKTAAGNTGWKPFRWGMLP